MRYENDPATLTFVEEPGDGFRSVDDAEGKVALDARHLSYYLDGEWVRAWADHVGPGRTRVTVRAEDGREASFTIYDRRSLRRLS